MVCSEQSTVAQRVRGLRMGVDDWIGKPCHPEEVVARVEAVTRRHRRVEADAVADAGPLTMGELEFRIDRYEVLAAGRPVDLTKREYELLLLLARSDGRVLPREDIYQRVWGYAMARGDRSVDVFVRKVRHKLEAASPGWRYVHTHFGIGYRFDPEPDDASATEVPNALPAGRRVGDRHRRAAGHAVSALSRRPADEFFDLFEAAIANAERSAQLLLQMLEEFPDEQGPDPADPVDRAGGRPDHPVPDPPARRRIAPAASRGAIHKLAGAIDDVVDYIEEVADSFGLYKIEAPMDPSVALAQVLLDSTRQLGIAIGTLRTGESMTESIIEVHRLENEGDRLSREAIASLFAGGVDPMVVIRWKDIFEHMEKAIDACEDVAHTLEGGTFDA